MMIRADGADGRAHPHVALHVRSGTTSKTITTHIAMKGEAALIVAMSENDHSPRGQVADFPLPMVVRTA